MRFSLPTLKQFHQLSFDQGPVWPGRVNERSEIHHQRVITEEGLRFVYPPYSPMWEGVKADLHHRIIDRRKELDHPLGRGDRAYRQ